VLRRVVLQEPAPSGSARRAVSFALLIALVLIAISATMFLLLGPYEFDRVLRYQLAMIAGAGLLLCLLYRPQAGLALLLVGGLLVSRRIGTGTATSLNGAVLMVPVLAAVWMFHLFIRREKHAPVASRTMVPIIAFMVVSVLATLVGQYPWLPAAKAPLTAQLGQLGIFLFSGFAFLVSAHYLRDLLWLKRITLLFILIGLVHLFTRLPGMAGRTMGLIPLVVHAGSMFWTWLAAISFGQFLLNRDLHPFARLAAGGVTAAVLAVTLIQTTAWVSGWLPCLIAIFVILLIRYPRPLLLAAPVLAVLALIGANVVTDLATAGDNLYSLETRVAAIKSLWPILTANPILGLGPANYYKYTEIFPILGWYVSYSSHNNYLDLIAQTGLVGLGCFLWFGSAAGIVAWKLRNRVMGGFERGYVYSVIGGLAATFLAAGLGDWVIPFVYNAGFEAFRTSVLPWVFLGGLVALEQREGRV